MLCDEKHVGKNNEMINKINSLVHVQVQFAFFLINHQNLVTVITYPFMDSQVIQTCIMVNSLLSIVKDKFLLLKKCHHISKDNLFIHILVSRMLSTNFLDNLLKRMLHRALEHENDTTDESGKLAFINVNPYLKFISLFPNKS
ncbi:hypothetical protein V8G54_010266 [Vigna mungo]|uniref:Uncharacterized protein n=1 Tax=Vigna mungo TaxID=3915 RepID=A0AAQ3S6B0_VIGMU